MSKYYVMDEDAVKKLCGAVRESHSVSEGISDDSVATNSTYSSKKIEELLESIDAETVNGHTVESDVPSDAVFTDTVYELPTAGYGVIGGVKSGTSLTSASGYSYCPIIDGRVYYKTDSINAFKLEAILGNDSYYEDDSGNIVIKIPIPKMLFYQNVYDIYILNGSSSINSNNPSGFSHLTVVPLTWAYPTTNVGITIVNKTNTIAGGAVVTSFTATLSSTNSYDDNYLTITVTGSTGNWQNNLFAMVVVTG